MEWVLAKYRNSSPEELTRFVNSFARPPQNAVEAEERERMRIFNNEIAHAPPESLHPIARELQGFMRRNSELLDPSKRGAVLPEVDERKRIRQYEWIEKSLQPYPALQTLQNKVNVLFRSNEELDTFNLPAFLNATAKHLKREEPFLIIECFRPTKEVQLAQLDGLSRRKPDVHAQLVQLVIQAFLTQGSPHPQGCTCPLCDHLERVIGSTSTSKAKPVPSASRSKK